MNWDQLREQILHEIQPGHRGILKCDGDERRRILSNDGEKIVMDVGAQSKVNKKYITYEMICFVFEKLSQDGKFDRNDFRGRYGKENKSGGCLYSMIGGILVEFGLAVRPHRRGSGYTYKQP